MVCTMQMAYHVNSSRKRGFEAEISWEVDIETYLVETVAHSKYCKVSSTSPKRNTENRALLACSTSPVAPATPINELSNLWTDHAEDIANSEIPFDLCADAVDAHLQFDHIV